MHVEERTEASAPPKLPAGYYAVDTGDDPSTFEYKGITYSTEDGVNRFASVIDAAAAARDIPGEVLPGLGYTGFDTPVILFSAGRHKADLLTFDRPLTLLGQGAGITPSLPAVPGSKEAPPHSPERSDAAGESVLFGSYWRGKIIASDPSVRMIVLDGFTADRLRFIDSRTSSPGGPEHNSVIFRNIIYTGACGSNLCHFSELKDGGGLSRSVIFENIRMSGFDDLGYGGVFILASADELLLDGVVCDGTTQVFGFSDITRSFRCGSASGEPSRFTVRNSYFANIGGENGICASGGLIDFRIEGSVFVDASRPGESPVEAGSGTEGENKGASLVLSHCRLYETRGAGGAAVTLHGSGCGVVFDSCVTEGFDEPVKVVPPPPKQAPAFINTGAGMTDTADPHRVIGCNDGSLAVLDGLYTGRRAYYGDLHVHTDSGGTSDGKTPIGEFTAGMDACSLDFAAVVDHRQMRGFFLPEWDERRFIIGTEPGTAFLDLNACRHGQREVHYNMLFPHRYGLAMVLANFPEFCFRGDELTGSFKYPKFTKGRFAELTAFVQSIGGIMVHPHPKTMLASDDPLDYYFGERMFLETIYGRPWSHATFRNYELWREMLALGLHVYASGGSDTHGRVSNSAVSVFYSREMSGRSFFDVMHSGDFTVGAIGIKMAAGKSPMGSEDAEFGGNALAIRTGDFFPPAIRPETAYRLNVYSDRGLAYTSVFDGVTPQALVIETRERAFYRAEILDITHGFPVAIGNPVWAAKNGAAGDAEKEDQE